MKKIVVFLTVAVLLMSVMGSTFFASAADVANATIDATRTGSITLYKYDITSAERDNAWDKDSYVSTGVADPNGVAALAPYAIQGVEFTYVKIADLITEQEDGVIEPKYTGLDADILAILSVDSAASYTPDDIHSALSTALTADVAVTKNALESYVTENGGTAMPETDAEGKTSASDLPLGLYILVETLVPENVTATTAPFFISLPMTTIDGDSWNYDVCVYPKNETGMPTLEKTVREAADSTGKTEDYAHTATASVGDVLEYRISSDLPAISSGATFLTAYTFVDTLSEGLTYNKNDVVIGIYNGETKLAEWTEADTTAMFTVTYGEDNTMTIAMTAAGLAAINANYSEYTLEICYAATLNSDAVLGSTGNDNDVALTWKRTNATYYDTLTDCCHVFSYGFKLTKLFSDNDGNFANVEMIAKNASDDYFIVAELSDGIWNVTGFDADETNATHLIPNEEGFIILRGIEDDTYVITEVKTDDGYNLLKDDVTVVITTSEGETVCDVCTANLLTAAATVNDEDIELIADGEAEGALVPFKVINNKGIGIPITGDMGTWLLSFLGAIGATVALLMLVNSRRRSRN